MTRTRVVYVNRDQPDPSVIAEAAAILRSGGLVAFATETVYGLGADATNPKAVARIFEAKGRPSTNPVIVHVADKADALACVADWPKRADLLADRFWPGPLTLILPRSSIIPDIVTAGQDTVGVRVPRTGVARWLILEAGCPIAAPSANRSMGISPTTVQHVIKDLDGKVDLILDSGPSTVGIESTVLDLSGTLARVLRPGEVTYNQIVGVTGESVGGPSKRTKPGEPARSPGQLPVHYAPLTPAYRIERDRMPSNPINGRYSVLTIGEDCHEFESPSTPFKSGRHYRLASPEVAARGLYATLHLIDELGLDFLLVIPPPNEPCWLAVRDRIDRATQPWSFESDDFLPSLFRG